MASKRKKYPRLPNGFGSIRYLGGGRRNPFAVHPPAALDEKTGDIVSQPALCYVDDYMVGIAVLTAYHARTYYHGYELSVKNNLRKDMSVDEISKRLMADYRKIAGLDIEKPTFENIYNLFFEDKFCEGHNYSKQTIMSTNAAYKNCKSLHKKEFQSLKYVDLQRVVDECTLRHASLELIVSLMHQMYSYAIMHDYCDKDYSQGLKIKKMDDDKSGIPFTNDELALLWKHKNAPFVDTILIYCYSGWRINELARMPLKDIDLNARTFTGGLKNRYSRNRIVPIHSSIYEMVSARYNPQFKSLIYHDGSQNIGEQKYREYFNLALLACGIQTEHTPHDCRHTFSKLCEDYGVAENDRKRMLGHSFGNDVTNRVYGHRDLESLREQIEKIDTCDFNVTNEG